MMKMTYFLFLFQKLKEKEVIWNEAPLSETGALSPESSVDANTSSCPEKASILFTDASLEEL